MTTQQLTDSVDFERPPQAIVDRLAALPAANIGDAMERLGVVDSAIQAIWAGAKLAGPAFTVWARAGDNLGIHSSLSQARPGDVVVVYGEGDVSRALLGELIGERALSAGIHGFALDGAARDADALAEIGMPVFARATTPAGPYKFGPYRTGVAIAFGGVPVHPGDIIIGDADGLVVVPRQEAAVIADAAEAVFADELQRRSVIVAARTDQTATAEEVA